MPRKPKFESPGHYTAKDREKIPSKDFGDPKNKKYPIVTKKDYEDAKRLAAIHHASPQVKNRIENIAKRKGFK